MAESSKASSSRTSKTGELVKVYGDLYVRAYWEIMTVAKYYYTWVHKLPELHDGDAPIYAADQIEMSREDAVIPMPASDLVSMMMNVKEWEKTFMHIVYGSRANFNTGNVLSQVSRRMNTLEVVGVLTKFQLPTTFVPMRDFSCLRYLTKITEGVYAIIDVSIDLTNPIRKSGVIIRDKGQNSEIIWLESVPDMRSRRREITIYASIINSKLVFEPKQWISTLLWDLKRQRSAIIEAKIHVLPNVDGTLLEIADNMKLFFKQCVAYEADDKRFEVSRNVSRNGEFRIMGIKRWIALDNLDLLARICVTSFAIHDITPLKVFQILVKMNVQLLLSSLPGVDKSCEQVLKFESEDGSNSITLHRKRSVRDNFEYYFQEASRSDYCSFVIARPMTNEEVEYFIVSKNGDPFNLKLESTAVSGFAIMPNGPGGLNSAGCLVTYVMQLNRLPQFHFSQALKQLVNDLNQTETGLNKERSLFSCMPCWKQ
ncbi:hypothetical protein COLO4_34643 [Corchorus olitorius]|uniref:START domain-containing protein n=1 Tax=Corchorus olitorius TaxID=93759 RepID=A0A1R3GK32_9ROSI|nr:hypothetical protein COLO4_34643 [Corchorus olitorius]